MDSESKPPSGIAFLENGRILVKDSDYRSFLIQKGYGVKEADFLVLAGEEALYLMSDGKLRIFEADRELTLKDVTERLIPTDPDVWIRFLIYRDLRDRGYIVREYNKVGFEIYGKGALRRLVAIVYEGHETSLEDLEEFLKIANEEKKELILAVVDRRTDIVYYSLSELQV
mgnify:CR=1 FL=1